MILVEYCDLFTGAKHTQVYGSAVHCVSGRSHFRHFFQRTPPGMSISGLQLLRAMDGDDDDSDMLRIL